MDLSSILFGAFDITALLLSVIIHEVSHGSVALALGDPTARNAKRLSLNPIRHLELFGSILLPVFLIAYGQPPFGWAKPVPYNPYALRKRRWGAAIVGLAGPFANVALAVLLGFGIRGAVILDGQSSSTLVSAAVLLLQRVVAINLFLALFNLIPLPPLDGSRLLFAIFPRAERLQHMFDRWGMVALIFFFFFFLRFFVPLLASIVFFAVPRLTGLTLL